MTLLIVMGIVVFVGHQGLLAIGKETNDMGATNQWPNIMSM